MASHNRATKLQYYKPALLQSKIAQAHVQWAQPSDSLACYLVQFRSSCCKTSPDSMYFSLALQPSPALPINLDIDLPFLANDVTLVTSYG